MKANCIRARELNQQADCWSSVLGTYMVGEHWLRQSTCAVTHAFSVISVKTDIDLQKVLTEAKPIACLSVPSSLSLVSFSLPSPLAHLPQVSLCYMIPFFFPLVKKHHVKKLFLFFNKIVLGKIRYIWMLSWVMGLNTILRTGLPLFSDTLCWVNSLKIHGIKVFQSKEIDQMV